MSDNNMKKTMGPHLHLHRKDAPAQLIDAARDDSTMHVHVVQVPGGGFVITAGNLNRFVSVSDGASGTADDLVGTVNISKYFNKDCIKNDAHRYLGEWRIRNQNAHSAPKLPDVKASGKNHWNCAPTKELYSEEGINATFAAFMAGETKLAR